MRFFRFCLKTFWELHPRCLLWDLRNLSNVWLTWRKDQKISWIMLKKKEREKEKKMIEQQKKLILLFLHSPPPLKTCSKLIENMNANCRYTASLYGHHQQQDAANGKYCYSSWGWACGTEAVWFQAFIQNLVVNSKRKLMCCFLSLWLFYWQAESTAEIWNLGCKQTIWTWCKGCGFESYSIHFIFYW